MGLKRTFNRSYLGPQAKCGGRGASYVIPHSVRTRHRSGVRLFVGLYGKLESSYERYCDAKGGSLIVLVAPGVVDAVIPLPMMAVILTCVVL